MITSKELNLYFKGSREYVQGTSMLDAAMEAITQAAHGQSIQNIIFSINKMTAKNLVCDWWEKGGSVGVHETPIATCFFDLGGVPYEGRLVETGESVNARFPFDESLITRGCEFSLAEKMIKLVEAPLRISSIEILVSMNKALHYELYSIPSDSQWVFCRWESVAWPLTHEMAGVRVIMEQSLGTRLTRARVELNEELIGRLYFSARQSGM